MALREFKDRDGVVWKVWDVTPEYLDKRTTAEDYMRDWQDGWLCFECRDSRRRLASFPPGWEALSDGELEQLLHKSQVVKRRAAGAETSGEFRRAPARGSPTAPSAPAEAERPVAAARPDAGRMTPAGGMDAARTRTFKDSRGRSFVAGLYRIRPESGDGKVESSPGTVLRFISGSVVLDLAKWPDDWDRYPDEQLVQLLERAQPADASAVGDSLPLRRQTDLPG